MTADNAAPPHSMNQKIFSMGLSTETVSLYLLCCGLKDVGEGITTKRISEIWNASPASLQDSITALEEKHILRRVLSEKPEGHSAFEIVPPEQWAHG